MPLLTRIIPIGLVLLAWELVARLNFVNPNVFPPVTEIVLRFATLFIDGRIYGPLWGTLWRALAGLFAAIALGVPLGLLMGRVRWAQWFFEPLFSFGFPLPKIALIPLYVHWFGLFSLSKVMLVFTDCLFPIVLFTYHGARGLSPVYLWSAQSRGTGRVRMFWRVVLPLSAAAIYDGIQVAVVVAVLAGMMAPARLATIDLPRLAENGTPKISESRRNIWSCTPPTAAISTNGIGMRPAAPDHNEKRSTNSFAS